jgi:succinate-acetate transporter protein
MPLTHTSWASIWACGVFTLFMFFGTLKANRALQFVFLSLTVLFALLAIGHLVDNEGIVHVAGWIGLVWRKRYLPGNGRSTERTVWSYRSADW